MHWYYSIWTKHQQKPIITPSLPSTLLLNPSPLPTLNHSPSANLLSIHSDLSARQLQPSFKYSISVSIAFSKPLFNMRDFDIWTIPASELQHVHSNSYYWLQHKSGMLIWCISYNQLLSINIDIRLIHQSPIISSSFTHIFVILIQTCIPSRYIIRAYSWWLTS